MGYIIDGKEVAKEERIKLKTFIEGTIKDGKRPPCLATILVGDDGGSKYYMKNQGNLCKDLGMNYETHVLPTNTSESELLELINMLNEDKDVDGIMLQVPLPPHIDEKKITSKISADKDVDGLTDINLGKFYKGESCFVPCTPQSAIALIKSTGAILQGKIAVVIGRSNIVGKPVAQLLLNENCTVIMCHSKTKGLSEMCKAADILVSAIGRPRYINSDFVKEGAIVIDVGTTMVEGKVTGDVDFESVKAVASYITPVPGGVGSMTTTILLKNTCEAYKKNVY